MDMDRMEGAVKNVRMPKPVQCLTSQPIQCHPQTASSASSSASLVKLRFQFTLLARFPVESKHVFN